jgi:putative ABC transport system permease protein
MMAEVLGHGVRLLRKSRGFVALAVVTLGLGIGAVVAVFQVVDAALLHPLPYPDAESLVVLWGGQKSTPAVRTPIPPPDVADLEKSGIFSAVVSIDLRQFSFAMTGEGKPEQIGAARVSPGIFTLIGVDAALGRVFTSNDPEAERGTTAVISDHLWKERYGADPRIAGKPITLDGTTYTIVGVMPSNFRFPIRYQNEDVEAWMSEAPLTAPNLRGIGLMFVLARVKPGATMAAASQELDSFNAQLTTTFPDTHRNRIISLVPLTSELAGAHKTELLLLLAAVGIVLLIACTNVANLMLVRGSVNAKETALRVALGASRKDIILQFFSESATLAVLGCAAGFGFAFAGTRLLVTVLQVQRGGAGVTNLLSAPALTILNFNGLAFLVAAGVLVLTVFLVGMAPALGLSGVNSMSSLQETKRVSTGVSTVKLRSAFLVGQVALSLVLAVGAGLFARSLSNLLNVSPGFRVEHLLTYQFTLPAAKYPNDAVRARFYHKLLDQIQTLPGVESVAAIGGLPLTNWIVMNSFVPEGVSISSPADAPIGNYRAVSPDYFATMGIRILSGQTFSGRDDANAPKETIVNEALARRYWPNTDPVGRHMKVGTDPASPWYTITGVVGNVHQSALDQDSGAEFYVSYLESPARSMGIAVRTQVDPVTMLPEIQNTVRSVDPDQPIAHIATMTELVQDAARPQRARFVLLGTVTALALLIAAVGLFALVSYLVSQRSNELGVRMALGAPRTRIFWLVVGQGLRFTLIGVGIGAVLAVAFARSMAALLFGISVFDPAAFAAAVALLLFTAVVACALPALHAARLDPMHALRHE